MPRLLSRWPWPVRMELGSRVSRDATSRRDPVLSCLPRQVALCQAMSWQAILCRAMLDVRSERGTWKLAILVSGDWGWDGLVASLLIRLYPTPF